MSFVNIGFGNIVNSNKVIGIVSPEAAPIKRLIQTAKDHNQSIDATCGRKTKSVVIMENTTVILSALHPETIAGRMNSDKMKGEYDDGE